MSENPFIVKKPRKWFDKPIKLAFKDPIQSFFSAGVKSFNPATYALALADAVTGLIKMFDVKLINPGEACFALVFRAYQDALRKFFLSKPEGLDKVVVLESQLDVLVKKLTIKIGDKEYDSREAAQKPLSFSLIKDLSNAFKEWLQETGMDTWDCQENVLKVEKLYLDTLGELYVDDSEKEKYQPFFDLIKGLDTPIFRNFSEEREWELFRQKMTFLPDEPILAEAFDLRSIYVSLCAKFKVEKEETEEKGISREIERPEEFEWEWVDLKDYLDSWVLGEKPELPNVQFISGGPGSGKSSFCKMWAAHLAEDFPGVFPLFIPLHRYRIEDNLDRGVRDFLNQNGYFNKTEFKLNGIDRQIVLILDGLDELTLSKGEINQTLRDFIESVMRQANNWDQSKNPISILISGREITVQENEQFFRDDAGWLRLLPYKVEENKNEKLINLDDFTERREDWWQNFQKLRNQEIEGFPASLKSNEKLEKLSSEPLLNYLLAILLEEGLEVGVETQTNEIYQSLISSVYKRDYLGSPLPDVKSFGEELFFQALEEIAVACLQQETQSVTVEQIEKEFHKAGKEKLVEYYWETGQTGSSIKSLVMAFYFRAAKNKEGKEAFEFTHKSFMEYLVARKIVKLAVLIEEEMNRNENPETSGCGLSRETALIQWFGLMGPLPLNRETIQFIFEEAGALELEKAESIQKRFAGFIGDASRENLTIVAPADKTGIENTREFGYMANLFRNGTIALFAIASGASGVTKDLTKPDWIESGRFGTLLRKICPQITSDEFLPILDSLINLDLSAQNLSWINLSGANLCKVDLRDADLRRADLSGANLRSADLSGANLRSADLSDANLIGANLSDADLSDANLIRADLSSANLRDASLIGANLSNANLIGADLIDANLIGANLSDADLSGANLIRADLSSANLSDADLSDANLIRANLSSANLIRANLSSAKLSGANLSSAKLSGANFIDANLRDANLHDADLSDADLSDANLSDANLRGTNLRGANLRGANLGDADLSDADLRDANLRGANLRGANLDEVKPDSIS